MILKHFENRPEIVDRDFGIFALKRLGLKHRHETFGRRSAVESFFSKFKEKKRFWNRFPFNSSFDSTELDRELPDVVYPS